MEPLTQDGRRAEDGAASEGPAPVIMHVLEALEGGTARHVVDLVRHATTCRHEIVTPLERVGGATDADARPAMAAAGATLHELAMRRDPIRAANAVALARLVGLVRARRPDVLHAHSSIAGLLARLAGAATGTPTVYTPHAVTENRAGILVERALGPVTAALIAVSRSEAERVASLRLVRRERVTVIENGIELVAIGAPPLDLRAHFGLDPGTPLVGTISRLVPQKAPEDLVAAWAAVARRVPEARFVLVGSGPLQGAFDAAVERHQLAARVFQLPSLPGAARVLDQLQVFTLASRFEGAPYSLLEAMRAGTPIAATEVVGTIDLVDDHLSGLLAPAGEPEALGAAIVWLLTDEVLVERLVAGARAQLVRRFDVADMAARTAALYEQVISSRTRPGRRGARR